MESAVIYCRKSDVSALPTDVSFDDQETVGREHAAKQGYSVYKVYRESHSGADLLGRKQIWEAMDDIRQGKAQVLIVRNWDRLARKTEHAAVIRYEVREKAHGRIESALDGGDGESLTDKILDVVAEAERLNAVARMERGKVRRAERGELMASPNPLFGYRWADDTPGKRTAYTPDPETSPIVQRIFKLAMAGQSLRSIARLLNAEGVPTRSQFNQRNGHLGRHREGVRGWSPEGVRRVISDRTYTGEATAYRWQRVRSKNGGLSLIERPADDPKRLSLSVPALVDVATYDAANKANQAREGNGRPPIDREASWLRLHVYCGICGHRMEIRRRENGKYLYLCRNRQAAGNGLGDCAGGAFGIRAHLLDNDVYAALGTVLSKRDELHTLLTKHLRTDQMQALTAMSEGFQAQIAEKGEELETARRLSRQTKDPALSEQYLHDAETLNTEIHRLRKDYAEAREQLDTFAADSAWVEDALRFVYESEAGEAAAKLGAFALAYNARRLLLVATGLRAEVFPKGWREDGRRVVIRFAWDAPTKPTHTSRG